MNGEMRGQKDPQRKEVETLHLLLKAGMVTDFSVAIDGGSHVGTWAKVMADHFQRVIAFEPTLESFEMLAENLADLPNVEVRNDALMDCAGLVNVLQPSPKKKTLTSRFCEKSKSGTIPCIAIDDLNLETCGLIKLDLEGAEPLALRGASKTIKRCSPTLVVEVWGLSSRFGFHAEAAHEMVLAHGYREIFRSHVDRIYRPI